MLGPEMAVYLHAVLPNYAQEFNGQISDGFISACGIGMEEEKGNLKDVLGIACQLAN